MTPLSPRLMVLIGLLLAIEMLVFNGLDVTLGAFPLQAVDLGASPAALGLLAMVIPVVAITMRTAAVRLSRRLGLWTVLVGATVVVASGPVLYALSRNPLHLGISQAVYALGPSTWMMAIPSLLTLIAPAAMRGRALGWYGAISSGSLLYGPALGIWLYERHGTWGTYGSAAGVGLAAVALALTARDLAGGEQVAARQAPPVRYNFDGQNLLGLAGALCAGACMASVMGFLALYGRQQGVDAKVAFVALAVCAVGARLVVGRLLDRVAVRSVAPVAASVLAAGLALIALAPSPVVLFSGAALAGAGHAGTQTSLMKHIIDAAGEERRAPGVGWFFNATDLGIALGAFLFGQLAQHLSFTAGYLTFAIVALATVPVSLRLVPVLLPAERVAQG